MSFAFVCAKSFHLLTSKCLLTQGLGHPHRIESPLVKPDRIFLMREIPGSISLPRPSVRRGRTFLVS